MAHAPMTPLERRNARLVATYGIDLAEYDALVAGQAGVCAICQRPPAPGRVLVVDHNHDTGTVRGLLCAECNTGLGLLGDSPMELDRALAYLHAHGSYGREGDVPGVAPDVAQTHPGPIEPRGVADGG